MARRNDKVTVTHTQILVWAIQHQENQRKVEEERLNRLEQINGTDPALKANLEDSLRKSIDQYDQVLKILHQMFEFETGNCL